jgi:creatinine amidohydrolase/Fe(II)-dependent formamide hydrolase-like protein
MTHDLSRSGVIGDPTKATPEKGMRWLAVAAGALASQICALRDGTAECPDHADLTVI